MKKEIKNPQTPVKQTLQKQWKSIDSTVKNVLRTKIRVFKKQNRID